MADRLPPLRESELWQHLQDDWSRWRGGFHRQPQMRPLRIETAYAKGWPDVFVQDTREVGRVAVVELKVVRVPQHCRGERKYPARQILLGVRPDQALWLWKWRMAGGHASILCALRNSLHWIWVPVWRNRSWCELIVKRGGWIRVPHLLGLGPYPPLPHLYHLEPNGATYQMPERPGLDDPKRFEYIPWPNREKAFLLPGEEDAADLLPGEEDAADD